MSFVVLLLLLVVLGAIGVVAAGRGDAMRPAEPDRGLRGALPPGPVSRSSLDSLRFTLAFRGYRMDEVDDVLDRVAAELEAKDARIAQLEGGLADPVDVGAQVDQSSEGQG